MLATALIAAALFVATGCAAVRAATGASSESSLDNLSGRCGAVAEAIDRAVRTEMRRAHIQGISVALVDPEGVVWSAGYGRASAAERIPAAPDTLYRVGSVTKPLTAYAVLLLAADGLVDLDAPLQRYVPEFEIRRLWPESRPVTVRMLLSHHAGLKRDHYNGINGSPPPPMSSLLGELRDEYLVRIPGESYRYSNIGYALLGILIERVTGISYAQFMRTRVFEPLGMYSTQVGMKPWDAAHSPVGYEIAGLLFKRPVAQPQIARRDAAAGSVVSTAEDLAKFVRTLLTGSDATGPMPSDLRDEMFALQYEASFYDDDDYGLGWKINKSIIPGMQLNVRHGGTLDGYSSLVALAPHDGIGIVVLSNTHNMFARHVIADAALAAAAAGSSESAAGVIPPAAVEPAAVVGRYVAPGDVPLVIDIGHRGDRLYAVVQGQRLLLRPSDSDRFRAYLRVLGLRFSVAPLFNVDDVMVQFVTGPNDDSIPVLILRYGSLEMRIPAARLEPARTEDVPSHLPGRWVRVDAGPYQGPADSMRFLDIGLEHGRPVLDTVLEGSDVRLVLKDVGNGRYVTVGTGEVLQAVPGGLRYSGLEFGRGE